MRTWIKGGILLATAYLIIQFIDDFLLVFFGITPLEKARYLLYLDFLGLHDSLVLQCGSWFEACGILYVLIIGFIMGMIIGGIVGMFNKEVRRREIINEYNVIREGRLRGDLTQEHKRKEEKVIEERKKREEERKRRLKEEERRKWLKEREEAKKKKILQEEEVPDIEIIPLKVEGKKKDNSKRNREKRRKNRRQ